MQADRLIWEDDDGEIDFDQDRMESWFSAAVQNLAYLQIPDDECAWMLFLMGAETAIRGNKGQLPDEEEEEA